MGWGRDKSDGGTITEGLPADLDRALGAIRTLLQTTVEAHTAGLDPFEAALTGKRWLEAATDLPSRLRGTEEAVEPVLPRLKRSTGGIVECRTATGVRCATTSYEIVLDLARHTIRLFRVAGKPDLMNELPPDTTPLGLSQADQQSLRKFMKFAPKLDPAEQAKLVATLEREAIDCAQAERTADNKTDNQKNLVPENRDVAKLAASDEMDTNPRPTPPSAVDAMPEEPLTDLQKAILKALDGRALKADPLADEVSGGDRRRLYKPGGIKDIRKAGMVKHKHGVGYYRPDRRPPDKLGTN